MVADAGVLVVLIGDSGVGTVLNFSKLFRWLCKMGGRGLTLMSREIQFVESIYSK